MIIHNRYFMPTPAIRSPYTKIAGLVWFGRMLDKIRVAQAGQLPPDYEKLRGKGLDGAFLKILQVDYAAIEERVRQGGSDEDILNWCFSRRPGGAPGEDELRMWNHYLSKMGWRDEYSERRQEAQRRYGIATDHPAVHTYYDLLDLDEGRTPPCPSAPPTASS